MRLTRIAARAARFMIVLVVVLAMTSFVLFTTNAAASEKVMVLVPDRGNLQYMSFWVAKGGGYFMTEGIDVEILAPPGPQQTATFFERREADIAVLPPPVYVTLMAKKVPVVLVANLLANDPIELVVRRSVLASRKLSADMPLKARLEGLRGLRLGVAPHPPTRLRALFASQGLDADKDTTLVILHGKEQNAAFHEGRVDVLYAHTPYVERAIVHDDAVVLVDQCRGEVPELANRQIHVLAVNRVVLETRRELVAGFVRAIARAEELIQRSQPETVAILAREMPDRDRRELETIVRLYQPAIPKTPSIRAEDIQGALTMFPAGMEKPDLTGIDLKRHVATDLIVMGASSGSKETAQPSTRSTQRAWTIVAVVTAMLLASGTILVIFGRKRHRST